MSQGLANSLQHSTAFHLDTLSRRRSPISAKCSSYRNRHLDEADLPGSVTIDKRNARAYESQAGTMLNLLHVTPPILKLVVVRDSHAGVGISEISPCMRMSIVLKKLFVKFQIVEFPTVAII